MRQIDRFVSAASLPVGRLLELAGLKGALLMEAAAEIECRALNAHREIGIVLPELERGLGAANVSTGDGASSPADWLVGLLADSVVNAIAPRTKKKRTSPRESLAASLRPSRTLASTLSLLRELCRSDGARVTEALAAPGASYFLVHAPIDLEYALQRPARVPFVDNLQRAREIMRMTGGRVLPLVPFDPRRPGALAYVREAMSRGFAGVAFEPRGGVRVIGNAGGAERRSIERALIDLYSYCTESDVPLYIPAESPLDEAADPRVRLRDIKKVLATRRFARLRLCIGGVGSLDGWGGAKRNDRAAFARSAAGMAVGLAESYPNVFCDVGAAWPDGTCNPTHIAERVADAARRRRAIEGKLIGFEQPTGVVEWLQLPLRAESPSGWSADEVETLRSSMERAAPSMATRTLAVEPTSMRYDCLVLGAGISGMTTARNLCGWRRADGTSPSVLVLEGSQRVGGRMHTLRGAGLPIPVEMGAELIHRPEGDQNSGHFRLWDEVHRYGIETRPIDKLSANYVFLRQWTSNPSGQRLRGAMGTCLDLDVGYAKRVLEAAMRHRGGVDRSARDLRDALLADFNAKRANAEDMADYLMTGTVPGDLSDLSVAGLASDRVKEQEFSAEEYHVAQGYDLVPRMIGQGVPVEFGAVVRRVEWWNVAGDSGVRVFTDDGRTFEARTAVCTFSIGVLRHGDVEFARVAPDAPFEGLPASKREAIEHIGFGAESKLIMQFKKRFWPDDFAILSSPGRGMRAGRSFFNPSYRAPGSPAILTAFLTRSTAEAFDALVREPERWKGDGRAEDAIEAFIRDNVLADLAECLELRAAQRPKLDDVIYWHCRCWGNDPLVRGGTSYLRFVPGTSADAMYRVRAALADPTDTLPIFWAGEAAAVGTNPWSVHGAHMSGIAAGLAVAGFLAS
ncbi:MAG: NAD(P)/FAD-dependent oxidoreductase [Phycisphaerales bacterium]